MCTILFLQWSERVLAAYARSTIGPLAAISLILPMEKVRNERRLILAWTFVTCCTWSVGLDWAGTEVLGISGGGTDNPF